MERTAGTAMGLDPSQVVCSRLTLCFARLCAHEEHTMLDILMLALAAGFFALAIGYTYACERL
ncbi:conserved exported hypothetical protein [Bradyrhizobium oligotrophicum S58]|uniref:Uncharacterized protein n=1 Tax=Bradyrhizobium oligotrophicum S58 TaxID=1245469 RepID=M4ZDQ1_9BRAD|nr:hypothetical protein [Bradyrhizobium oligotrophicum]BAM91952.1 conserved exported hypothetical protein [Bradyrhizobium oligotrophicum S58]